MGRCKIKPRPVKSSKKYTQAQLIAAIEEVKNGSTQFAAAHKYSIPRSTLYNKISGKTLMDKKSGPGTVLSTAEENIIKKWMFTLGSRGFPVTKGQLLRSIQLYLNINKRDTIFTNNYPGRKWYDSFLTRHPTIREKISQNLTSNRASVTAEKIKAWHLEVLKYCEESDLLDILRDPTRIFNMDEKGFILANDSEVVLVEKSTKAVYSRSKNDSKECVTALLGGSASGKPTPPMVVHSYKRMPSNVLLNLPPKWNIGISDNGWQTQQTFYDYIKNVFHPWLLEEKIPLPIILFIDGHKSHVSLNLSDFCADNQIVLIGLYPNSTHITQPMDVGVFKSLNASWKKTAKEWRITKNFAKIEKKDVAPILHDSIKAMKNYSKLLQKAFQKSGLFPFDAGNIDLSRILPSIADCANAQEELWNQIPNQSVKSVSEAMSDACNRLQHIESLIGESVLSLFRSSGDDWTGALEYSALFIIWQQMNKEASETISTVNSNVIIVDIENLNVDEFITSENCLIEDAACVIIDETCTGVENYLQLVPSSMGDLREQLFESEVPVRDSLSSSELLAEANATVYQCVEEKNSKSIEDCNNESGKHLFDAKGTASKSVEFSKLRSVNKCIGEGNSLPKTYKSFEDPISNGEQLFVSEVSVTDSLSEKLHEIDVVKESIESKSSQTEKSITGPSKCFDPDAFKSSFFWPVADIKKNENKIPKEKTSTVFSGEAWRNSERKKLEEKMHEEAEKKARKVEREMKKEEAIKVAAEKKILRETKKLAAVKMATEKEKKRQEKQLAKSQKLTNKATPLDKQSLYTT